MLSRDVATACSTAGPPPVIVDQFTRVPANLVFFEVLSARPGTLRLVDAESGAPIAASVRVVGKRQVFAPDVPVAAHQRLALEVGSPGSDADAERFEFETSDAVDLALKPLELELVDHDGLNVTFRYSYPEEYEAIRHLVRLKFTLDGSPLSHSYPLDGYINVKTTCDNLVTENSCSGLESVPAGEHVLQLSMELVGLEQGSQSVSRRFETSCEQGCNVAGSSSSGSDLWLVLLALGARTWKRRRCS